jgi:hypothetical protein
MTTAASSTSVGISNRSTQVAPAPPRLTDDSGGMSAQQAKELEEAERLAAESGEEAVRTIGKYEAKEGKVGKITKKKWYIVDPRSSKVVPYWDGIGMVRAASLSLSLAFLLASSLSSCGVHQACVEGSAVGGMAAMPLVHAPSAPRLVSRSVSRRCLLCAFFAERTFCMQLCGSLGGGRLAAAGA